MFKKRILMWALALAAISAVAPAPAARAASGADPDGALGLYLPTNPLEGARLFSEKRCIQCHSIQGVGGKTGPDLGEIWLGSAMEIVSKIWNHFPRMNEAFQREAIPPPTLSDDETQKLISFLYYLNFFDRKADADTGERLFREKSCIRCHSVGGKGGDVGPKLDPYQGRYAAPFITAALWNHGPAMMRAMVKENIPRPSFAERDVVDILAFIRARGLYQETTRQYVPVGNAIRGKELIEQKGCLRCHSIHGRGGTRAPDLAKRDLKRRLSSILSHMWNHGSKMWPMMKREGIPFPKFSAEDMSDVMTFLYFLEFQDDPGSAARGKQLFVDKKCAACHLPAAQGAKTIAPNLAEAGLTSPVKVVSGMWNHLPGIEQRMREMQIHWPLLDTQDMRDLVQYILVLNGKG